MAAKSKRKGRGANVPKRVSGGKKKAKKALANAMTGKLPARYARYPVSIVDGAGIMGAVKSVIEPYKKIIKNDAPSDAVRVPLVADVCVREEQEAQDGHLGQTFTSRGAEFKAS